MGIEILIFFFIVFDSFCLLLFTIIGFLKKKAKPQTFVYKFIIYIFYISKGRYIPNYSFSALINITKKTVLYINGIVYLRQFVEFGVFLKRTEY
jgi:hypothetical protein